MRREVLPGVRCVPAHDTHTAGSQYVTVENARDGRWLLAGDNCYVYENFIGLDGRFTPIGLVFGSVERCILTMEEMWQYVGEDVSRIVPFHEQKLWDAVPDPRVRRHAARGGALARRRGEQSRDRRPMRPRA